MRCLLLVAVLPSLEVWAISFSVVTRSVDTMLLERLVPPIHTGNLTSTAKRILLEHPTGNQLSPSEQDSEAKAPWWAWEVLIPEAVAEARAQASHRIWTSRVKHWRDRPGQRHAGPSTFFESVAYFEWMWFFIALIGFVILHCCLFDWPSSRWYHSTALLIWLSTAAVYCFIVWCIRRESGSQWLAGYFLELIFSIENIFIYHIVVEAFRVPRKSAQKALFIVVCCQVVFQLIFYLGLASWLRSLMVLPYILGVWLVYVGIETARENDHGSFNIEDSLMVAACRRCLGNRLSASYRDDCSVVFYGEKGEARFTLLLPAIACLLVIDFVMEVDVTLTKIEEISNSYISFTSSVAAAFAVPELFFVARDMFKRYYLLKYGITFVLLFFGSELLLHRFVHIPDMVGIGIIVVVLIFCIALSKALHYHPRMDDVTDSDLDLKVYDGGLAAPPEAQSTGEQAGVESTTDEQSKEPH